MQNKGRHLPETSVRLSTPTEQSCCSHQDLREKTVLAITQRLMLCSFWSRMHECDCQPDAMENWFIR